jgi:hypothetical protein
MYSVALPNKFEFSSQFAPCLVGLLLVTQYDRAFRLGGCRLRVGSTSRLMVLRAPHPRFHKCCSTQWFTACDQGLYSAPFPLSLYIIS